MALPWLIGIGAVAAASYVASKFSDDDSSSSHSYSSDNEEVERRHREQAEKERKAREAKENKTALLNTFKHDGEARAQDFKQVLQDLIELDYDESSDSVFDGELKANGVKTKKLIGFSYVDLHELKFLDKTTQKNLLQLELLYSVELNPAKKLKQRRNELLELKRKLKVLRHHSEQLDNRYRFNEISTTETEEF